MMNVLRLGMVLFVIFLECNGIRIRGSTSITYDPSNPTPTELTCEDDSGNRLQNAQWRRINGSIDPSLVDNTGRLILGPSTINSSGNPQSFEDQYYCEENEEKSSPVSFYVIPSRISAASTVRHQLGKNVTINCPLRFGNLREDWNVEWTVKDNRNRQVLASRYETRKDPGFQLVINASVDFDGTTFLCKAFLRNDHPQESQTITLELFHEPEITSSPYDPIVVELAHGTAEFEIKAYPRPSIEFCFNNSCYDADGDDPERVQIRTDDRNNGTIHTASFTINHMTVEDNGNVTLKVNKNLNSTVMLFKPYKLQVSRNNSVSTNNGHVYLLISLRRPLHFNYEIEFIDNTDKEEVLVTMEGKKGTTTLSYPLIVTKDTEVMARFKVGDARGPNSDPVPVEVQNPETTENSHMVVYIVVAALATIVVLAVIAAICFIVNKLTKGKRNNNTSGDVENGKGKVDEADGPDQTALKQRIEMNPIDQPHIGAVIAPTPGNQVPQMYNNHHFGGSGPFYIRPLFGSASSGHSSIPSRKSSAGYESGTGSFHCPCSQYAANYSPRCCHCEHPCDQRFTSPSIPPEHYQPHEQMEDEHDNAQLCNSQQLQSTTTNLSTPKPPMRRNSSDPNISRHKQPPLRPLEEQRTKKLLSSSSVV